MALVDLDDRQQGGGRRLPNLASRGARRQVRGCRPAAPPPVQAVGRLARSARSLIPRSIRWLITKATAAVRQQAPELALVVLGVNYALPMAAWMRFRGMAWRLTLEMSGAMVGLAIVMVGLDWLDVVRQSSVRGWVVGFCGPACVVMVIVMLFRLGLYTGRTGHQMGHARRVERVT